MEQSIKSPPVFPRLLALPLGWMPALAHSKALVTVLNRLFAAHLRRGDLDFLQNRVVRIGVPDAHLNFCFTLAGGKLMSCRDGRRFDLSIEGSVYDFLLLVCRREDSDTLFFARRLRLGGNTELGLNLKNFLDALEPDEAGMDRLLPALEQVSRVYERLF